MDIFAELDVIFSRYAKPSNYIDRDHCGFRRKLQMKTSEIITLCDLSSQGIELLCGCLWLVLCSEQLPLTNGMHSFYSGDRTPGGPKGLEAEHGTRQPFHCPMVLLDDVIEIFRVAEALLHNSSKYSILL
jgi:hypothetical protein